MSKDSYEEAIKRLEEIIRDLQDNRLPVDSLIAKAAEAKKLVQFCQQKLRDTELELSSILEEE